MGIGNGGQGGTCVVLFFGLVRFSLAPLENFSADALAHFAQNLRTK